MAINGLTVLGYILPTGTFHPGIFPPYSPSTLFRFVARFASVRIEDSSGNRFASTAYFAKPYFVGGNVPGGNNRGGAFWGEFSGGEHAGHLNKGDFYSY